MHLAGAIPASSFPRCTAKRYARQSRSWPPRRISGGFSFATSPGPSYDAFEKSRPPETGDMSQFVRWLLAAGILTVSPLLGDSHAEETGPTEAELRKIIEQADRAIQMSKGRKEVSAEPYLKKGRALLLLKQP